MAKIKLKNRILRDRADEYNIDARTARIEIFKRKELFVSRQERRGSRISTFVESVPELVEEVARIHAGLREDGVFVMIDISPPPPGICNGSQWHALSEDERNEFVMLYMRARD